MNATDLLAEITRAFEHEPYPGDFDLVTNNEPDYDLESLQIRESFKVHTWQTMPDSLLFHERSAPSFLSKKGLRYYLPAFMQFAVREYVESDTLPDDLVNHMTLPTELDGVMKVLAGRHLALATGLPTQEMNEFYHSYLRDTNQWVHRFIDRYGQFDRAQSRAILHFLEYLRDEHGQDYFHDEPAVAIERYWFQFAD